MARTKRQTQIPGTERETIKEVNAAAEEYVEARDERMGLTEREVQAKQHLLEVMKENKLTIYRDDNATPPLLVTITPGEDKIKVSRVEEEDGIDEAA